MQGDTQENDDRKKTCKWQAEGEPLQASELFFQHLARLISPWNLLDTWSIDFFILYIVAFLMQTTCRYPREKFHWNFIFCTCICTQKLWREEKNSPESIAWSANTDHVDTLRKSSLKFHLLHVHMYTKTMMTKGNFPRRHHVICQYRPRNDNLRKSSLEISFFAHAYVRTLTEKRMLYEMNWICINVLH